jgi:hypothetical protein
MEAYGVPYAQASVAKALFDYLYLRPLPANLEPQRYNLVEDLRLNLEEFTREEWEEFAEYVLKSETVRKGGAKMRHVQNNLEVNVWRR